MDNSLITLDRTMAGFDHEEFLNRPYYAYFDFGAMLGDVLDFLEFSEGNLEWQYRVEKQSIERQAASGGFLSDKDSDLEDDYRNHLLENAEHRFTVSLPMRLRYASLVAFITTVEWQARHLEVRSGLKKSKEQEKKKRENEFVRILQKISDMADANGDRQLDDLENLVFARNLVVHAAGLPRDYRYSDIGGHVLKLQGFTIGNWHFLGETLRIERGALVPYIEEMQGWIPTLMKQLDEKGLLNEQA